MPGHGRQPAEEKAVDFGLTGMDLNTSPASAQQWGPGQVTCSSELPHE